MIKKDGKNLYKRTDCSLLHPCKGYWGRFKPISTSRGMESQKLMSHPWHEIGWGAKGKH